jgi:outer membrane protein OmpA-like peptidoglycan-associated protein
MVITHKILRNSGMIKTWQNSRILKRWALIIFISFSTISSAYAGDDPFVAGWTLKSDVSNLNFQSVKNKVKVESSSFATLVGTIDPTGEANVSILLDSVDTKIDLRNVRMRFLLFETFQFPEAAISTKIGPELISDLSIVRRKQIKLPYTLDLHGFSKDFEADLTVTLLTDDLVSVATSVPISVAAVDFGLTSGIEKLEDAAKVEIVPSATVTFDFLFARNGTLNTPVVPESAENVKQTSVALEAEGNFDLEACKGRFEILSRAGNIYFKVGSARLEAKSAPLLDSLADIILRCPGLVVEVGGHTDSDGSDAANERLSRARAASVVAYLTDKNVDPSSIVSVGYGEKNPLVPNTTAKNKWKNRRIEFSVVNK